MSSYRDDGRDRGGYNGREGGRRGRSDAYEARDGGRRDAPGSERRRHLSRSPRRDSRSTQQPGARGGSDGPRRSAAQDLVSDPESGYSSGEDPPSGAGDAKAPTSDRATLAPKGSSQASNSKAKADDSTPGDSSSQAKEEGNLALSSCRDRTISAIVKGTYTLFSRNHDRPVYKKDEKSSVRQSSEMDVFIYYWDERDGPDLCGWWISPSVGGDEVWAYHSSRTSLKPPPGGWNVPHDGETDPTFAITPNTPKPKDEVIIREPRSRRDRSTSVKREEVPADTAARSERRVRGASRAETSKGTEVKPSSEAPVERRERGVAADSQMSKYLQARSEAPKEEAPKEQKEPDTSVKSSDSKPADSKKSFFAEIFEKRLADARRERRQRDDPLRTERTEEAPRAPEKEKQAEPKIEEKKVEEPKVEEQKEKDDEKPEDEPEEKVARKTKEASKGKEEESDDYESYEDDDDEDKEKDSKKQREEKRGRDEEPAEDKRRPKDREDPRCDERRSRRDRDGQRGEDERPRSAREDQRVRGERRRNEDDHERSRRDPDDRRGREERRGRDDDRRCPDERRRRDDERPTRDNRRRHDDFLGDDPVRTRERRRDGDDDRRRPYDDRQRDFHRRRRDDDPRMREDRPRRRDNDDEENVRPRGDPRSRRHRGEDDEREDRREDRRERREGRREDRRDRGDSAEPPRSREQRSRDGRRQQDEDEEPLKRHSEKTRDDDKQKGRSASPSTQRTPRKEEKQDEKESQKSGDVREESPKGRDESKAKEDEKDKEEKARAEKEEKEEEDRKAAKAEELRKAKEEEMKKLEEDMQRKRDEKRKAEDVKRKEEEETRQAEAAKKRKVEEEKRKAEEEEKKKKEEEDKKRQEEELLAIKQQESTLKVLAVLQKLASTTPSNFEALQKECDDILKTELENCGPQRELLEAEARQVVQYAKHYVNQELENKKKQQELKEQEARVLQDLEDLVCAAEKAAEDVQALAVPFDQGEDLDTDAVARTAVEVDRKGRAAMKACSNCADFITERKGMIEKAEKDNKELGQPSKLKAVLPRIRLATAATATACQHAKEKKEFIKTRRAKKWFTDKCTKQFDKYDKDGDGVLNSEEVAAYAKSEFDFEIPEESMQRIRSMLVPFGKAGIAFDNFPKMRTAIGIARNEVSMKRRKVDRRSREEFVEDKRQILKTELEKSLKVLRDQEDNIGKVEGEAQALVKESAGMQPDIFQQRLQNLIQHMAALGTLMNGHKEMGQQISKALKELPEIQPEINPGITEVFKRLVDYEARLEKTGTVVSAARQMAVYVSLLEYERLWREVVVGLRVCLEQQARPIEELYDTIAVRGGDTISTVQIHAFLLDHHCALEKDKVDKVFGRWALTQQNALATALRKKAEAEAKKAKEANEEEAEDQNVSKEDLLGMNVPVLKTLCKSRKLPDTGDKDELVNRLHASYSADSGGAEKADGATKAKEAAAGGTGQDDLAMGTLLVDSTIRLTRAEFMSTIRMYYKVVRQCVLSDHLLIDQSKQLRHLQVGELLDVHRGPAIEPNVKIYRIHGRIIKDSIFGWSTIAGNQGITFLQLIGRIFKVRKEVALTGDLKDVEGAPLLRNLQEGEYIEVLEFAWTSRSALGVLRVQVRVEADQSFGWVTVRSNDGTVYLEELMTETT